MRRLLIIVICISSVIVAIAQSIEEKLLKEFHNIRSEEVNGYAKKLCGVEFKGRLSGTPEYMNAAHWVADNFSKWGIKPILSDSSYFQMFNCGYTIRESVGELSVLVKDKKGNTIEKTLSFPDDFLPGSNSGAGLIDANIVYVGYGISAPELKFDEYKNVDVKGKVVIIESGVPYSGKDKSQIEEWSKYVSAKYKVDNAVSHGAVAILHVGLVAKPGYPYNENIVYAHIGDHIVSELFFGTNKKYNYQKSLIKKSLRPASVEIQHRIKISAETTHITNGEVCNVIGVIEGSDPILKNEVIILGAHLDGQGNPGALFPGALDNASGVANVMATAKALSSMEEKPKRSILFILYGGEEEGLLGSGYYADNPLFPLNKTLCVVNMDMVGNGRGFVLTRVDEYPLLKKHFVESNNNYLHRTLRTSSEKRGEGNPRTDGHLLYNKGYRAFGLWISDREKTLYYHHPYDTMETLTPEIMEDVSKWMFISTYNIANDTLIDIDNIAK